MELGQLLSCVGLGVRKQHISLQLPCAVTIRMHECHGVKCSFVSPMLGLDSITYVFLAA